MPRKTGKRKVKNLSAKTLIKLGLVLFLCIYVTCIFVKQQIELSWSAEEIEKQKQENAEAMLEQKKLKDEFSKAGSDEYIEYMAREKLGLVKANERVFIDITQE